VLANVNRGEDVEPFDVMDFMPLTKEERAAFEAKRERERAKKNADAILARAIRRSAPCLTKL
jgi:hypothetical protein